MAAAPAPAPAPATGAGKEGGGLSLFVGACFVLNYLVGTGFLTLPWAFGGGGLLLSSIATALVCLAANAGSDHVLSAMVRAEILAAHRTEGMSFLELSEQAATQVILSGCRILAIALMVATPLAAVVFGSEGAPHFDRQAGSQGAPLIDAANSYKMIPIVAYSVLFHQAVPGLADEMTDKRSIGRIFGLTFALCAVAYILIGVVVSWYFGDLVHASSNLNWAGYHGGTGSYTEDGTLVGVAWWARMISSFVVVFPAIDVLSGYPINAYVLGNSLLGFVHRGDIDRAQGDRTLTAMYRGIASVPPIVGALFVRDLGTITDFSGLTGLAIAFCFPPLLFLASERKLREHGLPSRTYYERFGSSSGGAWAILVFGLLTIVICASFLILNRS